MRSLHHNSDILVSASHLFRIFYTTTKVPRYFFLLFGYFFRSTKYGMYEPHCGLDNLLISWSHDEYMYQFLKHNKCTIPEKGLYMIRYDTKLFQMYISYSFIKAVNNLVLLLIV